MMSFVQFRLSFLRFVSAYVNTLEELDSVFVRSIFIFDARRHDIETSFLAVVDIGDFSINLNFFFLSLSLDRSF